MRKGWGGSLGGAGPSISAVPLVGVKGGGGGEGVLGPKTSESDPY